MGFIDHQHIGGLAHDFHRLHILVPQNVNGGVEMLAQSKLDRQFNAPLLH